MKLSFPHTDLLIEHLAQGTKVSSILFDHPGHRFAGIYMALPQCIEDVHNMLPHKTRVRHKKQAQVLTVSKMSLRGVSRAGPGASRESGGVQAVQEGPARFRKFQEFQARCRGGPEALQPAVKHEKIRQTSVKTQLHPGLCAGGSRTNGSRYPPLGARRGLPR